MSSGAEKLFVVSIIGFFAGLYSIYLGASKYLLLQKILNTPTSKVRSVAVGLTEISGRAVNKTNNLSPISKVNAPYWEVRAEYYQSGKNSGWKKLATIKSNHLFYVEDETGRILVDPQDGIIEIPPDRLYTGYLSKMGLGLLKKLPDKPVLSFIKNLDSEKKKIFMAYEGHDIRLYEHYIAEGDSVYVLGNAEILENSGSPKGSNDLILKKNKLQKLLYISDSHEENIQKSIRSTAHWSIFLGFGLSVICLILILVMLDLL